MPSIPDPSFLKDKYLSQSKSVIMSDLTVHNIEKNGDMSVLSRKSIYVDMKPMQSWDSCVRYKRDSTMSSLDPLGFFRPNKIQKTTHHREGSITVARPWDRSGIDDSESSMKLHLVGSQCLYPLDPIIRDSSHWSLDAEILGGTLLRGTSWSLDNK